MASDGNKADVHGILDRHHIRYEVHPFLRRIGASSPQKSACGSKDTGWIRCGFPWHLRQNVRCRASTVKMGTQLCSILKRSDARSSRKLDSSIRLLLDTHEHFQPEVMLRIRISHGRGL